VIYIATTEHGRGVRHITSFKSRRDLFDYADDVLSCNDRNSMINKSSTISRICDALEDNGVGFGSRSHQRISQRELIDLCAAFPNCWNLYLGRSDYCQLTGRAMEILEELELLIKKEKRKGGPFVPPLN